MSADLQVDVFPTLALGIPPRLRKLVPNSDSSKGQVQTATLSNLQTIIVSNDCMRMPKISGASTFKSFAGFLPLQMNNEPKDPDTTEKDGN